VTTVTISSITSHLHLADLSSVIQGDLKQMQRTFEEMRESGAPMTVAIITAVKKHTRIVWLV
jgi:hypothetical protein